MGEPLTPPQPPAGAHAPAAAAAAAMAASTALVFAHRGARAHAPENTLLAFRLAFDLGADAIECDVQRTADGALVIIHDGTLNRTTSGRGQVATRTLAELRALDAGLGQSIPTLDDVLALCAARDRQVNLEIKAESERDALVTAEAMAPVLASLDAAARARVLVSSFALAAVAQVKRDLPWLRVATLHGAREWRGRDLLAPALAMQAEAVHPETTLATPTLLKHAHDNGRRVHVWTANRPPLLRQLLAWGVDGVFSDFPERAIIARTLVAAAPAARTDG